MDQCPCGSKNSYNSCCEPYVTLQKNAPTALTTMRARYSAYVKGNIDFIKKTHDPDSVSEFDEEGVKKWSEKSIWTGLSIVDHQDGGQEDTIGTVEFIAKYKAEGMNRDHHELAQFRKIDDFWYYTDGEIFVETIKREGPKVGRNDPCPCGSGKKYKKCCL